VGKTGLACGLLLKALHNGHRGVFVRAQDLFDEMYASLADRSTRKLLKYLARIDVLLIDSCAAPGYVELPTGFAEKQGFLRLATPHNYPG
jgi:DNA replication protein DnaC